MTLKSGKVYSNTGAPNNADGINGDIYMQLDGFKTTYRKETGSWVAIGSTLGAIPEFVSGVGAPSNSLGIDGQYYRETSSQNIYYKQGGVWALVGNLLGASFGPILDQAGIGKYLGTAPNVVTTGSMNDLIITGEYYVTGSVTNMPPDVGAGYVKVWGLDSNNVAQIMQRTLGSSVFEIHFRKSSGGAFGAWTTTPYPSLATKSVVGISREATAAEVLAGALSGVFISPNNLSSAFPANDTAFQLSISLPNGYILKMGYTEYGELPAGVVTVPSTFTNAFPSDCLFALASPYNPNLSGQMAFICTMRSWSDVGISVDIVELSGSGHQFDASYVWFAIGK